MSADRNNCVINLPSFSSKNLTLSVTCSGEKTFYCPEGYHETKYVSYYSGMFVPFSLI